ncbi:MAG: class I SAM-dependent RNA methyltransferase, partial [Lachnospiraceae bacterium]|nr:class I SAM-dependent RNA methyltransferase [Lachnospiraceae bacterium]
MKKGQIYEGCVCAIDFPDKGIIQVDGEKAVVKHTLPGQKVSFVVQKKRKGKVEGRCLEILECSPLEIESPCPHFGICGGCTYQTLPYEKQCQIKEEQVRKLVEQVYINRNEEPSFLWEGIHKSPRQFGYRNKMEFSFGDEYLNGPLALGMHKRGSFYDIANVEECQIVDEDYRLILKETLAFFRERNASFYHKMRHEGFLRHLLVRKAQKTGEILIALVTSTKDAVPLEGFADRLLSLQGDGKEAENAQDIGTVDRAETGSLEESGTAKGRRLSGTIVGILHTKNDSLADVVQSDDTQILYGKDHFYEELLGLKFCISQFSFFQTISLGAEVLYQVARDYVGTLTEGNTP